MVNNVKANPIHGLSKVPDEVLLKEANIEIGKLNSEIDRLNHIIKVLKTDIASMSKKQLKKNNRDLQLQVYELRRELNILKSLNNP